VVVSSAGSAAAAAAVFWRCAAAWGLVPAATAALRLDGIFGDLATAYSGLLLMAWSTAFKLSMIRMMESILLLQCHPVLRYTAVLGHLYSKAYLFTAEKTSEPEGSTHAATEARSAGAHRVCSPSLSSLPDLVDLSRVLHGLVLQKIRGRSRADVLRSSK
jgi:hypothetical protein